MADELFVLYGHSAVKSNLFAFDFTDNKLTPFWPFRSNPITAWNCSSTKLAAADVLGIGESQACLFHRYNDDRVNLFALDFRANSVTPFYPTAQDGWDWDQSRLAAGNAQGGNNGRVFLLRSYGDAGVNLFAFDFTTRTVTPFYPTPQNDWEWGNCKLVAGDMLGTGFAQACILYNYGGGRVNLFAFDFENRTVTPFYSEPKDEWDWNNCKLAAGDMLGTGNAQACILYNYGDGRVNLFALDFKSGSTTPYYSEPQDDWAWDNCKLTAGDVLGAGTAQACILYRYGDGTVNLFALDFKTRNITPFYSEPQPDWEWNCMLVDDSETQSNEMCSRCRGGIHPSAQWHSYGAAWGEPGWEYGERLSSESRSVIEAEIATQPGDYNEYCRVRIDFLLNQLIESGIDRTVVAGAITESLQKVIGEGAGKNAKSA
jgi:hypothetical protein